MSKKCQRLTAGGKGNLGLFTERDPKICAAGLPTAQASVTVADSLQHYLLKDAADALISDAIIPAPEPRPRPRLRHPIPPDMRNAGPYGNVASIINPPNKTKFEALVDDFKDTSYTSYWKKPLGAVKDPVPMLPEGLDIYATTFGKPIQHDSLYDIVMPKEPLPDKTPPSKQPGVQVKRTYCEPSFNPDLTYGHRTFVKNHGYYARCCVTDQKMLLGTADRAIINSIQANILDAHQPRIGTVLAPNDNLKDVPEGYTFGMLHRSDHVPDCLTFCEINNGVAFFRKCLAHLNTLRFKCLSKRFLPNFFHTFYSNLKYYDKDKTGWLPKAIVYQYCGTKLIRFDPTLIEPLLSMWGAFDGSRIEYKTFVHILNYREPSPEIPKIPDLPTDCLDFRTTYKEMVKPDQQVDSHLMAGLPSGRYIDLDYPITPENCCKAHRTYLPEESDMRSCINPSVMTLLFVNHRDLYAKREPHVVRRVFEAAGEKFSDKRFNAIWEEAKQRHSQGWVCFETFRQTLEKHPDANEFEKEEKLVE